MRKEQTSHKNEHNTLMCFPLEPVFIRDGEGVPNFMDEPASGLDPLFRKELMRYLQEIVEDGTRSVLMSTHITEDLDRIGDYILLMKDGRIVWDLQIEEVRERYLIVYGTKEEVEQFRQGKVIYRSFGEYKNYAFIKKDTNIDYGRYRTKQPSLEEVMYCLEKGGYEDV